MTYHIHKSNKTIKGKINLDGSKSISNRVLIIKALSAQEFDIHHLSTSNDTQTLNRLLQQKEGAFDAGAAGTTFRFMTAFLALQKGSQILTGSARMKQRPIGVLVDALRQLGASIDYLEQEGYPPLKINQTSINDTNQLSISAGTSSQFISALLMIAPVLPNGLELTLKGKVVSRPYIEMTLKLMEYFGVNHTWVDNTIKIQAQTYQAKHFTVEADWSAASYYFAMAAFSDHLDLQLNGLFSQSLQGDAICVDMMEHFGVRSTFNESGVHLSKSQDQPISNLPFEWNFIKCPDIAQSIAVVCGGLGVPASFTGLETLKIKETDRITALHNELKKVGVDFSESPEQKDYFLTKGKAQVTSPQFPTYEDHRMAMAFAPLGMIGDIRIEDPEVVAKSYPDFWKDIETLGFKITHQDSGS